jgi:hypothetical protein
MNKTIKTWVMAAILIFCGTSMIGCGNKPAKEQPVETQAEIVQVEEVVPDAELCNLAVTNYLENVIGKNYAEAEHCIPCPIIISTNDANKDDVLVLGDFWVFNYNISGDTLKTISGGDHPGLMHLKKNDSGFFEVTAFEAVEDGAGNLESAKKIFGDQFDAFWEINSNSEKREGLRLQFVADYVKKHDLTVKYLQDFGWPAVALPE